MYTKFVSFLRRIDILLNLKYDVKNGHYLRHLSIIRFNKMSIHFKFFFFHESKK
jgi:hypothetical protein